MQALLEQTYSKHEYSTANSKIDRIRVVLDFAVDI